MLQSWIDSFLLYLALPEYGLSSVFLVSFVSATLLPLGSEPVVFGMVKLRPDLFWETVLVASAGNTLGGMVDYWMGFAAHRALDSVAPKVPLRVMRWVERHGARTCVLAWLPGIGDPLCAVAGWFKLPFWPCVGWMALGKFLRYLALTAGLVWMF